MKNFFENIAHGIQKIQGIKKINDKNAEYEEADNNSIEQGLVEYAEDSGQKEKETEKACKKEWVNIMELNDKQKLLLDFYNNKDNQMLLGSEMPDEKMELVFAMLNSMIEKKLSTITEYKLAVREARENNKTNDSDVVDNISEYVKRIQRYTEYESLLENLMMSDYALFFRDDTEKYNKEIIEIMVDSADSLIELATVLESVSADRFSYVGNTTKIITEILNNGLSDASEQALLNLSNSLEIRNLKDKIISLVSDISDEEKNKFLDIVNETNNREESKDQLAREQITLIGEKIALDTMLAQQIMPIDITIGKDTHLQIVDVRNEPFWYVDYLIIDPSVTVRDSGGLGGFKGIHENKTVILGHNHPDSFRFTFSDDIAYEHTSIKLKDGILYIEDLGNGKGGTKIKLNKRFISIKPENSAEEIKGTIQEFQDFAKEHKEYIEKNLNFEYETLHRFFYREFYRMNPTTQEYKEDDPGTDAFLEKYNNLMKDTAERLREKVRKLGMDKIIFRNQEETVFWCYINSDKLDAESRKNESLGRIYFNVKPEHAGDFFVQAVEKFQQQGICLIMKIFSSPSVSTINRCDKIVAYFDSADDSSVLNAVSDLYNNNAEKFNDSIPRFTKNITDKNGLIMKGISFGQEPVNRGKSFGQVRAEILAEACKIVHKNGLSIFDEKSDFESYFREQCIKNFVDPDNPAFNLGTVESNYFSEIKKRTIKQ